MIEWLTGGVRVYAIPHTQSTVVYRGCEIVYRDGVYNIWFLAISGREGRLGEALTLPAARRMVDAAWDEVDEG